MVNCIICSKKLTILNRSLKKYKTKDGEICLYCIPKLNNTPFLNNLYNFTTKDIQQFFKINNNIKHSIDSNNKVSEYKRTCLQCGKVWHSLALRENYLEKEKKWNDCNMCASAFSSAGGNYYSWGTWTQTKRNEHALNNEISKLKQCPNCMSSNYTEEQIVYEK